MDCDRIEVLLGPYLDGELGAPETAAVHGHLAGCRRCARRLGALKAVEAALRDARAERHLPRLETVLTRVQGGETPPSRPPAGLSRHRRLLPRLAAAVILVALLGVAIRYSVGREQAPSTARTPGTIEDTRPVQPHPSACLRPEDCGPGARRLWPAMPI